MKGTPTATAATVEAVKLLSTEGAPGNGADARPTASRLRMKAWLRVGVTSMKGWAPLLMAELEAAEQPFNLLTGAPMEPLQTNTPPLLQRPATLGDVAWLITLSMGMIATMTNLPREVLSSAFETLAKVAEPGEQKTLMRYIAEQLALGTAPADPTHKPPH